MQYHSSEPNEYALHADDTIPVSRVKDSQESLIIPCQLHKTPWPVPLSRNLVP